MLSSLDREILKEMDGRVILWLRPPDHTIELVKRVIALDGLAVAGFAEAIPGGMGYTLTRAGRAALEAEGER